MIACCVSDYIKEILYYCNQLASSVRAIGVKVKQKALVSARSVSRRYPSETATKISSFTRDIGEVDSYGT